jgi:hypothetical protein
VSDLGEEQPDPVPAEVAALDLPRAEKVARAYHLHFVQHQTITYTAQELGVARSTAWEMAHEGAKQAQFLRSTDEQVKQALADGAGWLAGALAAEQATVGGRWLEYAPVILKTLKFEAEVRGALAMKTAIISGQVGVAPDPDTQAALRALLESKGPSDGIAPQY